MLIRLLLLFLLTGINSFAQSGFKKLVSEAYDSNAQGHYQAAIRLLQTAAALKGQDTGYNESIHLYLGNNYEALNIIDSSIYHYGEALKYYEGTKDSASMAFIYNHLGSAEINFTKRYDKGIDYFKRQVLLGKDVFDCYNNIGIAYRLMNKYDSALAYFNKVAANTAVENTARERALLFTADTYSMLHNYPQALRFYNQSIDALLLKQDTPYIFLSYMNRGDCLVKLHRFSESMLSLKHAQRYLNTSVSNYDKRVLYHNLADVYNNTGDYKNAFFYKNLEGIIKDSLSNEGIQQAAAEANAKFEVRRSQDSLLISKQSLALSEHQSGERQRNFIIVFIIAIAVSLLAFLAFRNARIRKVTNLKLSALAGELDEANQTKARLFSIISHDLRSPISSMYSFLKLKEIKGEGAGSDQVTHLLDTMEDLLIWSKSQMDKFTLQPVNLIVHEVYEELIGLYRDVAGQKQVVLQNDASPLIKIRTDENLLKTILRNIISNAISHASPQSTVVLNATVTGKGIICAIMNEADKHMYEQLEIKLLNATPDSGSNGLGLFLTSELAKKLRAKIDLTYNNGHIYLQIYIPSLT